MNKHTNNIDKHRSHNIAASLVPEHKPAALTRKGASCPPRRRAPRRTPFAARLRAWARQCLQRCVTHFTKKLTKQSRSQHKLDVLEVRQLGEKRFVAVVRFGKQNFLIGGAPSSVTMLAKIGAHKAATAAKPVALKQEMA